MSEIVLNEEQAKIFAEAGSAVIVRNAHGEIVGTLTRNADFTPEEIEESRRDLASNERCYTTAEVLEYLRSLDPK
jgi:hypothetical protein